MLNLAVVGCGYWGPNLIRNFNSLSDCSLSMICDVDLDRLGHMKGLYPDVEMTDQFDRVINNPEIDAVVIATPVRFHFDLGVKCLEAGKHAFIEKPMASSVEECVQLVELAKKKNLTLMVGHTFIYSPPVRKIKEIVDSGELGAIQYVSSRRLNLGLFQKDINVTWDLAPHDISIVLYVMENIPISVNCRGKAHLAQGIEDVSNMTINFSNGGFSMIHSSWLDPNKVREMTFVGSKKMLVYDDCQSIEKIKIYDKHVEVPPHYDSFADFHYSYHYGDMHCPYLKQYEPLKEECLHFLDCITNNKKPQTSGVEGLQVVQILDAASRSLGLDGAQVDIENLYFS